MNETTLKPGALVDWLGVEVVYAMEMWSNTAELCNMLRERT